jgi:hypothetical protein
MQKKKEKAPGQCPVPAMFAGTTADGPGPPHVIHLENVSKRTVPDDTSEVKD